MKTVLALMLSCSFMYAQPPTRDYSNDSYKILKDPATWYARMLERPAVVNVFRDHGFDVRIHTLGRYRFVLGYKRQPGCVFLPPGPRCR